MQEESQLLCDDGMRTGFTTQLKTLMKKNKTAFLNYTKKHNVYTVQTIGLKIIHIKYIIKLLLDPVKYFNFSPHSVFIYTNLLIDVNGPAQ